MRKVKDWPNHLRVVGFPEEGEDGSPGGLFLIPAKRKLDNKQGYRFWCVVSIAHGWEHVSVTIRKQNNSRKLMAVNRCPRWDEMCAVKKRFWKSEEAVMQLHPMEGSNVNNHLYCLHLWRPLEGSGEIPVPNELLVGIPGKEMADVVKMSIKDMNKEIDEAHEKLKRIKDRERG